MAPPASEVHGFLTRDGMDPAALLQVGREEVRGYGARVLDGRVASAESVDGGFTVTLEDGRRVGARRLLVATGLGGWERNRPTAQVLASANAGVMAGAHINADLMAEDTREAVAARRDRLSSTAGTG